MRQQQGLLVIAALSALAATSVAAGERGRSDGRRGYGAEFTRQAPAPSMRSTAYYSIPDVTLVGTNGEAVPLRASLAQGPVMVNFVFTSCTTICPPMSATFAQVRKRLGPEVRLFSVSIDPEYDTPARLKAYAQKVNAAPGWHFLTGTVADSLTVQRAFDTFRGNKMSHVPVTLLRAGPTAPWVRIEGLVTAEQLVKEFRAGTADGQARR